MKTAATTATALTVANCAANACAWTDAIECCAQAVNVRVSAQEPRAAHGQHSEADDWGCGVHGTECPAPSTIDLTPAGRRELASALSQVNSVEQALTLLRQASVALYSHPDDQALRLAALAAVDAARGLLVGLGLALQQVKVTSPNNRFADQASALDLAEFSIHFPRLYREQRMWRLKVHWLAGHMAEQDRIEKGRR